MLGNTLRLRVVGFAFVRALSPDESTLSDVRFVDALVSLGNTGVLDGFSFWIEGITELRATRDEDDAIKILLILAERIKITCVDRSSSTFYWLFFFRNNRTILRISNRRTCASGTRRIVFEIDVIEA